MSTVLNVLGLPFDLSPIGHLAPVLLPRGLDLLVRETVIADRALLAAGVLGDAHSGAQLHHGLVEVAGALGIDKGVGVGPETVEGGLIRDKIRLRRLKLK